MNAETLTKFNSAPNVIFYALAGYTFLLCTLYSLLVTHSEHCCTHFSGLHRWSSCSGTFFSIMIPMHHWNDLPCAAEWPSGSDAAHLCEQRVDLMTPWGSHLQNINICLCGQTNSIHTFHLLKGFFIKEEVIHLLCAHARLHAHSTGKHCAVFISFGIRTLFCVGVWKLPYTEAYFKITDAFSSTLMNIDADFLHGLIFDLRLNDKF